VRPARPGFWGRRIPQGNARVEAYELKINSNNESFYLPHPQGGYVQFENLVGNTLQDGKLIMNLDSSIYRVNNAPPFAREVVLSEAIRQSMAASYYGMTVEWLVSDVETIDQLRSLLGSSGVPVKLTYLPE
jgi:hypothetical protein